MDGWFRDDGGQLNRRKFGGENGYEQGQTANSSDGGGDVFYYDRQNGL